MTSSFSAHSLIDELIRSLHQATRQGWVGVDCSAETLLMIEQWGKKKEVTGRSDTLASIETDLGQCQKCGLCRYRTHIVFGSGDPSAKLMFIGAKIESEDDLKGEPFLGEAGQLMTRIIAAMKLTRREVYLSNIVKCRPPNHRNPLKSEIDACKPFLERQIAVIAPTVICSLGGLATQTLLKTDQPISKLRGRFCEFNGIKVMPIFHPAELLRQPQKKRDTWMDIQKIMHLLNISVG
jgi:DNA polymerase